MVRGISLGLVYTETFTRIEKFRGIRMCGQNQILQVFDFVRKKKIVFFLPLFCQAKDGLCKAITLSVPRKWIE